MNWTTVDILVVVVFVLQIAAIGAALWARSLLNTSLERIAERPASLVAGGLRVSATAQKVAATVAGRAGSIYARVGATREALRFDPPDGFVVTPKTLASGMGFAKAARTAMAAARKRSLPSPAARALTVAERLGFVPPIVRRAGWLWRGGRTAWSILRTARAPRGARRSP